MGGKHVQHIPGHPLAWPCRQRCRNALNPDLPGPNPRAIQVRPVADVPFQIQHWTEQGYRITLGIDGDGIGGPEDTPGGKRFFVTSGDPGGGTALKLKQ